MYDKDFWYLSLSFRQTRQEDETSPNLVNPVLSKGDRPLLNGITVILRISTTDMPGVALE